MSFKELELGEATIELIDGDRGKNYPKSDELLTEGDCLFLSTKNVTKNGLEFNECQFITREKDHVLRKGKLQRHDVILTTRGTVGNVGYYGSDIRFNDMRINSGMLIVRPDQKVFQQKFVYYLFKSPNIQNQMKRLTTGSAQPQLPISVLKKLKITQPDINEQIAITAVLSSLDDKIELNTTINKNLEEMAQALFKRWFVDFEFPNDNGEPYKSSGGEFEESELGLIPKGWKVSNLSDCTDILMGQSPKSEFYNDKGEGLPFHQGVSDYGYRFPKHNTFCRQALRIAKKGSILVSVRAPVGRLNIADQDIIIGRGLGAINSINNCNSYTYYLLKRVFAVEDQHGSGTIFNSITKKEIENLKIVEPSLSIVYRFEEIVRKIDDQVFNLCEETNSLSEARDTLLPKLMSGEIRVPVDQKSPQATTWQMVTEESEPYKAT